MRSKKSAWYILFILSGLFIVFILLKIFGITFSHTSLEPAQTIAVVDRGQVVATVEASGVVEAENEVIILSPATAIIKKINCEPGSQVEAGMVIFELDKVPVLNEIGQITDQLEVLRNNLEKSRLNDRSTLIDLEYNVEVKRLRITSLKSQLADEEQLLGVGGISPARIEETKQSITLAEKELEMVAEKNGIRLKQLKAEETGLLLQIGIQEKKLAEKTELLGKMDVKAPSAGILLSVSREEGEKTGADDMLARMSDLSTFKINGSIDEKYSEYIKTGNQVFVVLENEKLEGRIGNITPVVENKNIRFNVHIGKSSHSKLIPNQTVNLQVVQTLKNDILRVPANNRFNPNETQVVLVKDSQNIVRKEVCFGIKGTDYQEIISGLEAGDQIVGTVSLTGWESRKNKKQ